MSTVSPLPSAHTADALIVTRNPFFNALVNRESAEVIVSNYGNPVLRHSTRPGLYAATYYCLVRRAILHTLFRQNANHSVNILTDDGAISTHYATIYDLLKLLIWGPRRTHPLVTIAPALAPLLPTVVAQTTRASLDEDPTD